MQTSPGKSLYQIIIDDILETIKRGQFSYDEPICTEKSLSDQYGVSRITSKRAIEELERAGILYRKRGVGSFVRKEADSGTDGMRSKGSPVAAQGKIIAFALPFAITQGGMLRTIEAATNRLSERGCHLTMHICEPDPRKEQQLIERLLAQHVDGLIFYPSGNDLHLDILKQFTDKGKPVIILDKPHDIDYLSNVVCDNFSGGYKLTEHLVDYGHRNIAYLSRYSTNDVSSIRERYNGFAKCLEDRGIAVQPQFINMNLNSDYPMLKHIINSLYKAGVTAIECENDEVAFNVYMCCRSLSILVPQQMNITGFDNIDWAVTGSAQLTTVDQNFAKIGETLAELILSGEVGPSSRIIPVDLIPRTSTGPARS
ncbi:substrate-binding domain-containing protein [Gorillibacterium massiliense]|uniref:substrate-binding domain-containing protein n=1 Tax=Gorillibacterium massiliense TaxID=1280390 RepID=UPI0004AF46EB|nr:GntR family transcriptional regulator [Gorillibacterium massiliense]